MIAYDLALYDVAQQNILKRSSTCVRWSWFVVFGRIKNGLLPLFFSWKIFWLVGACCRIGLSRLEGGLHFVARGESEYQVARISLAVSYTHLTLPTKA